MLKMPDSVKALYTSEKARKLYQIYFVDGSQNRIGNAGLISESVKITESICSEENFRFGLAECSMIEFECVGWNDMRGQKINVFLEIDIGSLTPAEIAEIQSGDYDGTIYNWSDVKVYRIQMGQFIITECPRTEEKRQHRKVKGYTADLFNNISPAEWVKLLCPIATIDQEQIGTIHWPAAVYQPDILGLVTAQLAYNDKTVMSDFGGQPSYIAQDFVNQASLDYGYTVRMNTTGNHTIEFAVKNYIRRQCTTSNYHSTRPIIGFIQEPETYAGWKEDIKTAVDNLNISWGTAYINGSVAVPCYNINDLFNLISASNLIYDGVSYGSGDWDIFKVTCKYNAHTPGPFVAGTDVYTSYARTFDTSDTTYVSFYYGGRNDFYSVEFAETYSFNLQIKDTTAGTTNTLSFSRANTSSSLRSLEFYKIPTKDFSPGTVSIDPSGQELSVSTYANGYDIIGYINGWFECMAMFVAPSRTGGRKMFQLPTSSPEGIVPYNYSSFTVDEYSGKKYGTLRFPFLGSDGEYALYDYRFNSNGGVYDMSKNLVLNGISMARSDLINYFKNYFIPHIRDLELNSLEMDAVGMPWLEPGDFVNITDAANRSFNAYPTRQVLKGIQALRLDIEAVGNTLET